MVHVDAEVAGNQNQFPWKWRQYVRSKRRNTQLLHDAEVRLMKNTVETTESKLDVTKINWLSLWV